MNCSLEGTETRNLIASVLAMEPRIRSESPTIPPDEYRVEIPAFIAKILAKKEDWRRDKRGVSDPDEIALIDLQMTIAHGLALIEVSALYKQPVSKIQIRRDGAVTIKK